jgi:hypothetical protein
MKQTLLFITALTISVASAFAQRVVVQFNAPLTTTPSVSKAPLRYDKDFAYSLTLDDGGIDAYTCAYPALNGGRVINNGVTYAPLYFTDGCGNNIPFRAGLAWNTANIYNQDVHDGRVASKMTWNQLDTLYDQGWDVFNHSYSHKARATATMTAADYISEILLNRDAIKAKTKRKINTPVFVVPSGDANYQAAAYAQGQAIVFDQPGSLLGQIGGLNVNADFVANGRTVFRQYLPDVINSGKDKVGDIANAATATNKIWYNEFTHGIDDFNAGSGFNFYKFRSHMERIANTWGKGGTDKVWMAPLQEVYEYMMMRNNAKYTASVNGNQLILNFDLTTIPDWLRRKPITLVVAGNIDFSNVEVPTGVKISFKGTGARKIINLDFSEMVALPPVNPCDTDTIAPKFSNCPANINITTTGTSAQATWVAPTATDNCSTPSVSSNYNSGNYFAIGTATIIYTAKDAKNNSAQCRFVVNITKKTVDTLPPPPPPPTATCSNNLVKNAGFESDLSNWYGNAQISTTPVNSGTKALKICETGVRVIQNVNAKAGATYNLTAFTSRESGTTGDYALKFMNNNYVPIEQNNYPITTTTFKSTTQSRVAPANAAFIEMAVLKTGGTGCIFADDICLTEGTITTPVVISPCDTDRIAPIFSNCPANISIETSSDSAVVNWVAPTATDNCGTPSVSSNFASGQKFAIGSYTVTYAAIDAKNNRTVCSFAVIVKKIVQPIILSDIAVSITTTTPTFKKYAILNFIITAKNIGTTEATNVQVEFKFPPNTVTGGEVIAEAGNWNEWCSNGLQCFKWTIPNLAAKGITNLSIPLYIADVDSVMFAQATLLASSPSDQNPANNISIIRIKQATTANTQNNLAVRGFNALPYVTLDAYALDNNAELVWVNNKSAKTVEYSIEKANELGIFMPIANRAEQFDNALLNYYHHSDKQPQVGENIYRIKAVMKDGSIVYSEPKTVRYKPIDDVLIFPNPVHDMLQLSFRKYKGSNVKMFIINSLGAVEHAQTIDNVSDTPLSIDVQNWQEGSYFLKIVTKGKRDVVKRFVIVK